MDPGTPLEQQYRELEILNAIADALNESVSITHALDATLSRVAELLDLHAGWVWLLDEATGRPYLAAARNLPAALADHPKRMEGYCDCLVSFRNGKLHAAANVLTCTRLKWLTEGTAGLRFHASIPLHARGGKLGVLNVASTEWRELSRCELRLLHIIGEMLGVAIERSRLFEHSAQAGAAEERNRLAREIHDTLAQGLAATALHLETVDALLESDPRHMTEGDIARVRAAVHKALALTRQNLDDARRSVLDLRPAPLEGCTLVEALRALCLESASGVVYRGDGGRSTGTGPAIGAAPQIDFQASGGTRRLTARLEAGLYRIAQEALANVIRHADARHVVVRLAMEAKRVVLTIEDDGRGFEAEGCTFTVCVDPAAARENSARFGVVGMYERARLLGGALTLQSAPGKGTRVEAVVPLDPVARDTSTGGR